MLAGVDGEVIASLLRDALEAYAAGGDKHWLRGGGEEREVEVEFEVRCVVAAVVPPYPWQKKPQTLSSGDTARLRLSCWADFFGGLPSEHPLPIR